MPLLLKNLSDFIRDWLFSSHNLNSTCRIFENASAYLTIENKNKIMINKINDDNFLLNLLSGEDVLVNSQLKLSTYVQDISHINDEEFKAFKQYLETTFGKKLNYTSKDNKRPSTIKSDSYSLQEASSSSRKTSTLPSPASPDENPMGLKLPPSSIKPPDPNDPPGFEDEYKLLPNNYPRPLGPPPSSSGFGDRDIDPFGKNPSLKPYLDPLQGNGAPGGMYPTRFDPLFDNPSLQRPSGARWDYPLFPTDDPEDIGRMGQGLPPTSGLKNPRSGFPRGGSGNPFGGSSGAFGGNNGAFGGGFF